MALPASSATQNPCPTLHPTAPTPLPLLADEPLFETPMCTAAVSLALPPLLLSSFALSSGVRSYSCRGHNKHEVTNPYRVGCSRYLGSSEAIGNMFGDGGAGNGMEKRGLGVEV